MVLSLFAKLKKKITQIESGLCSDPDGKVGEMGGVGVVTGCTPETGLREALALPFCWLREKALVNNFSQQVITSLFSVASCLPEPCDRVAIF